MANLGYRITAATEDALIGWASPRRKKDGKRYLNDGGAYFGNILRGLPETEDGWTIF